MSVRPPSLAVLLVVAIYLTACSGTPTATASVPAGINEIILASDLTELQPGECTLLHWEVTGGFEVTLDQETVAKVALSDDGSVLYAGTRRSGVWRLGTPVIP